MARVDRQYALRYIKLSIDARFRIRLGWEAKPNLDGRHIWDKMNKSAQVSDIYKYIYIS
jgi:hypothetical protein